METIYEFLLKASTGIALFYLVYWLFLRKETFYSANRWFLLLALFSAVIIPLFPIQYSVLVEPDNSKTIYKTIADTFKNIPVVSGSESTENIFNWQHAVLLVYLTGAVLFLLRLLTQTFILLHLMIKYRIKSLDGVRIVENEKYGLPFSFFNIVFINPKFHIQENLPEILAHEKVHIREFHWFDLLFIELLTVIFWFNPFIWFFEHAIKQNHEYLADKGVLAQGHSTGRYQALLINQLMGMQIIGITNNLNFALNTNRLKMMTKKKTSRLLGIKFAWALPAVALLLFAFAEPDYQLKFNEVNAKTPDFTLQKSEKELIIKGKVVLEEGDEPLPGASIVIKGSTIGTVSDMDGTFTLTDPHPVVNNDGSLSSEIVVSFVGLKTVMNTVTASGSAVNDARYTIKMEETVQVLHNRNYTGEQLPPPPPPIVKEPVHANGKTPPPPPPPPPADGEKEVFYIVEDLPKYPGGYEAMQDYIAKMQQKYARSKNIKGKVLIGFTVNQKGKVSDIKILNLDDLKIEYSEDKKGNINNAQLIGKRNPEAEKAAVEIVMNMEDWTPDKQRGKSVPVKYLLPVEF